MFAIVKIGSTQYKICQGDLIEVGRLKEEEGKSIALDKVLLLADGDTVKIGQPYLTDVKITAQVVKHTLGEKVLAFQYRRRKESKRTVGHRKKHTALNITQIAA